MRCLPPPATDENLFLVRNDRLPREGSRATTCPGDEWSASGSPCRDWLRGRDASLAQRLAIGRDAGCHLLPLEIATKRSLW
ncbi:MAG: hypothetical protein ACI4QD_05305 [Kiritimatiellia bacterium]